MGHFLVCYDIANPKRLGRVHRCAVKHAVFIQYSVYYLDGSIEQLSGFLNALEQIIDIREDDVRAYRVTPLNLATQLGREWMPEGIWCDSLS